MFRFFDIVSTKEKTLLGWGLLFFFTIRFFFKAHERLFDGFFFFNYGWDKTKLEEKNENISQGMYIYVRQKLIFHSLESEVNCEVG